MTTRQKHAGDDELVALLQADENSEDVRLAATHVEACTTCQMRLEQLAGSLAIDDEARELLSDYPWDMLASNRRAWSSQTLPDAHSDELDFLGPASHPELLGRLGRYEVERVIGRGGMGIVLKAYDTELNRPVAVKVLAKHLAHSGAARQRFARESRAAAAVVHEHVVAIHNVESDCDVPFLVMQFVAGESLQSRVDRDGPLDAKEILRIGIQAAAGLAAAHEQGVVHRDVKPANILLVNGVERVLLTDFGLASTADEASLTQTGVVAGTPHYMSPEQANGKPTDHRTDLFSLGSVMYFMATGHPPFRAERAMGVLNRICNDRHRPLWRVANDIPDELSLLIDRLLEKHPSRRIPSAEAARQQFVRMLAQLQQPRNGMGRRLRRLVTRYPRRLLAAMAVTSIVLAVAFCISLWPERGSVADSLAAPGRSRGDTPNTVSTSPEVSPVIDTREATEFEAGVEDLRSRIDALHRFGSSLTPIVAESETLQSLNERLDRLQGNEIIESPNTKIGEHR
ncbi:MAG: serine/threonine protein kinase [Planctomycetales bacterium]|nr:serine/threonine protein kinase [Planctomycetales bacterium]